MNTEILHILESVARDKDIPKVKLIESIASAVEAAGKKKYGENYQIRAHVNHHTGQIRLDRVMLVVDEVDNVFTEISLKEALMINSSVQVGQQLFQELPVVNFDRGYAQIAKQVMMKKIGEIEKLRQYEEYKNREGEIVTGILKRIEFNNLVLDLGRAEGALKKSETIPADQYKIGDRIKSYIRKVVPESEGYQIFLSRTSNDFLAKLMEMEITEIYDNIIHIKAIARDPGSKSKVAVFSSDVTTDPIGACVGIRGSRIKNIISELNGEKIDIVVWDQNVAQFITNAMKPAKILKIVLNENRKHAEVIVEADQLSLAIGKRGQNVRLASRLTAWDIDVITEIEESKRSTEEFAKITNFFVEHLKIDTTSAQLLVSEGFNSIDQLIGVEPEKFLTISESFTEELQNTIRENAAQYINSRNDKILRELEKLGVEQMLLDLLGFIPPEYILKIAQYGIKTIEDLEIITVSEFRKLVPKEIISKEEIVNLLKFAKNQSELD